MKKIAITLVGLGLIGFGAPPAQAASGLPVPSAAPGIELVSGGCGPYAHRDFYGYCRANGYVRVCPPYFHPTPYGCRRNY